MDEHSKPLGKPDTSATDFLIEMQQGLSTYAVNFEGFYWDSEENRYHLIELLKCEEDQWASHGVTPWESHPKRYWWKNKRKFLAQWRIAQDMKVPARYTLINYAEKSTQWDDRILVMEVLNVTPEGIEIGEKTPMNREKCKAWFAEINRKAKRDLFK